MIIKLNDRHDERWGVYARENVPEIVIIIIYDTDRQIWEGKGMRIAPLAV